MRGSNPPFFMLKTILYFLFLFDALFIQAQSEMVRSLQQHVRFLAADSLKGRATGSKEEAFVNQYLIQNLRRAKNVSMLHWRYSFTKEKQIYNSEMVGCFVNNKSKKTILISAHVDHIGWGSNLSLSHKNNEVHNGADDNASGVALVLELQKLLVLENLGVNVLFVFYSGHELGLFGSEYLVNNLSKKWKNILLTLNFDMVGRMDKELQKVFVSSSDSLKGKFNSAFTQCNLIEADDQRLLSLDCSHFHKRGIPSATFSTGMHNDYHKTSDDEKYINYQGIEILLNAIHTWLMLNYKTDN